VDGDGASELLVLSANQVLMYSGSTGNLLEFYNLPGTSGAGGLDPVQALPDMTGDGVPEIGVGERYYSGGLSDNWGRFLIFDGSTKHIVLEVLGDLDRYNFGSAFTVLPDLDQDGVIDFAICADLGIPTGSTERSGTVHIISGASGDELHSLSGSWKKYSYFGTTILLIPDQDGDGMDDLLIGAPARDNNFANLQGKIYCYSTDTFQQLWERNGKRADDQFGISTCLVPDQDGDGVEDFAVGAPLDLALPAVGPQRRGRVHVLSSASQDSIFSIWGDTTDDNLGAALETFHATVGGDDFRLLVGSPKARRSGKNGVGMHRIFAQSPFISLSDDSISVSTGGTVTVTVDFPTRMGGTIYQVLASFAGTGPVHSGVDIPLSMDWLLTATAARNIPGYGANNLYGTLAADGSGSGAIVIPANAFPHFAGNTMYVAAVAFHQGSDPQLSSAAVMIDFVP
jgi:hypothetical protein